MPITVTPISPLIGGVSQQANDDRLETQCEAQDNAYASVVDGLGKRQPTHHIRQLTEINGLPDPVVHWIDRDETERYALVLDDAFGTTASMKAFRLSDGTEIPITGKDGVDLTDPSQAPVVNYLTNSEGTKTARERLKALTIADVTYVLNTEAICRLSESRFDAYNAHEGAGNIPPQYEWKSISKRRWFLFQRVGNYSTKYAVRLHVKTGSEQPVAANKDTWDPPLTNGVNGKTRQQWIELATSWVKTFDGDYEKADPISNAPGPGKKYWGTTKHVPPYDGVTETLGAQIGTIQTQEILADLWEADDDGDYPGGIRQVFLDQSLIPSVGGDKHLSRYIQDDEPGKTPPDLANSIMPQQGPVMKLELHRWKRNQTDYREDMLIRVEAKGDIEDSLLAFSDEVQAISQLPLICEQGHVVKIAGDDDQDNDQYYVKFKLKEEDAAVQHPLSSLGEGVWEESMASLSKYHIDANTMPMRMVRVEYDDNGETKVRFEIYPEEWKDKTVGDDDTDPAPAFIDNKIQDIFLWRNRLGFLSESRFIMSEADEYSNFWRTTTRQLVDSDPIDLDAGHNRVANLKWATPLESELIIWTDRDQFLVEGDPILTPKTAGLTATSSYDNQDDVHPIVVERGVFYSRDSGGGEYSVVEQLQQVADTEISFMSNPSSEQVPRYIKGRIREMTATSLEKVLAVRCDQNTNVIYIYKWLDRGPDRLLSAWMRYVLPEGTTVHGMQFIHDDLYLVIGRLQYSTEGTKDQILNPIYLEKMTFSGQRQFDDGSAYRCSIDRRLDESGVTVVQGNQEIHIDLPYHVSGTDKDTPTETIIVSRPGSSTGPEGEQFEHTQKTINETYTRLTIPDPLGTLWTYHQAGLFKFYVGETYNMVYEFSRPALRSTSRNGGTTPVHVGRDQLLRGTIAVEDSGYGKVTVSAGLNSEGEKITNRDDSVTEFPQLNVTLGETETGKVNVRDGQIKFAIFGRPKDVRIILTNPTPYPCNPKSIHYEREYSERYTR